MLTLVNAFLRMDASDSPDADLPSPPIPGQAIVHKCRPID
jgi:hypothetical protein